MKPTALVACTFAFAFAGAFAAIAVMASREAAVAYGALELPDETDEERAEREALYAQIEERQRQSAKEFHETMARVRERAKEMGVVMDEEAPAAPPTIVADDTPEPPPQGGGGHCF